MASTRATYICKKESKMSQLWWRFLCLLGFHTWYAGGKARLEIVQIYFMYQKDVCIAIKVK